MAFTSLAFACFATILTIVYFAFKDKEYQWVILLIGSYVFYFFTGVRIALFMVFTTVTTYAAGRLIGNNTRRTKAVIKEHKEEWDKKTKKAYRAERDKVSRRIMALTLLANFGILFMLKYYKFLAVNINDLMGGSLPVFKFILPLGISFYTFQSMGYLIDVYRGDTEDESNLFRFALFVSFFPQIIQGPISAYDQLAHQLYEPHKPEYERFKFGLELILWGLFKKLVIADRASTLIAVIKGTLDDGQPNGTMVTFLILVYALQLYADFSAGIDISRGVAQILGIDMIQNFRQPYFSISLTDYWNRWHISLGAWMRNYIFYPLALSDTAGKITESIGNSSFGKTKAGAHIANVLPGALASLVVFLVVGIWHGAEWKYIWFGIWNGLVIMIAILIAPLMDSANKALHIDPASFRHRVFRIIRTFILVCIGYYFDVAENATQAFLFLRQTVVGQSMSGAVEAVSANFDKYTLLDCGLLMMMTVLLYIVGILREKCPDVPLRVRIAQRSTLVQWLILFVAIMTLLVLGVYGPGYDPQDFVYMQF
ncbi:MAG: MBOAT family protein [Clostridiales bacterium]|nr:MBOAT family protein [Clostridiales bacterium]